MKIRRGPNPGDHFTMLPNDLLQDRRLTLRARGYLAYLLSFPPGWETTVESVLRHVPEGRDALRACMRELVTHGYATRTTAQDDRGRWRTVLEISGLPRSTDAKPSGKPPTPGEGGTTPKLAGSQSSVTPKIAGNQSSVNQSSVNQSSYKDFEERHIAASRGDGDAGTSGPAVAGDAVAADVGGSKPTTADVPAWQVALAELTKAVGRRDVLPSGRVVGEAVRLWFAEGWTPETLAEHLRLRLAEATTYPAKPPGYIRAILLDSPSLPPTTDRVDAWGAPVREGDPRPCGYCERGSEWACLNAAGREYDPHEYQPKGAKKKTGDEILPPTGPQMAPPAPVRRSSGRRGSDEHQSLGMGSDELEAAKAGMRASLDRLAVRLAG